MLQQMNKTRHLFPAIGFNIKPPPVIKSLPVTQPPVVVCHVAADDIRNGEPVFVNIISQVPGCVIKDITAAPVDKLQ